MTSGLGGGGLTSGNSSAALSFTLSLQHLALSYW